MICLWILLFYMSLNETSVAQLRHNRTIWSCTFISVVIVHNQLLRINTPHWYWKWRENWIFWNTLFILKRYTVVGNRERNALSGQMEVQRDHKQLLHHVTCLHAIIPQLWYISIKSEITTLHGRIVLHEFSFVYSENITQPRTLWRYVRCINDISETINA